MSPFVIREASTRAGGRLAGQGAANRVSGFSISALSTCQVSPDGQGVHLHFLDDEGHRVSIAMSFDKLTALIMTLPKLATNALQARHGDPSLRIVFPLGGFKIEKAAGFQTAILTLTTPSGFEVAFALAPSSVSELHSAFAADALRAHVYQ